MTRALVIRPEAENDIQDAFRWYEEQESGIGSEFLIAVRGQLGKIARRPTSYQIVVSQTRRAVISGFPYSITFTMAQDAVIVTACIHHKRDPRTWTSRK